MSTIIRIISWADGKPCAEAGRYLESFQHDTSLPTGFFTKNPRLAMQFATIGEAFAFWKKQSRTHPRPDGKPNRPLTAWTVAFEPLEKANDQDSCDQTPQATNGS